MMPNALINDFFWQTAHSAFYARVTIMDLRQADRESEKLFQFANTPRDNCLEERVR